MEEYCGGAAENRKDTSISLGGIGGWWSTLGSYNTVCPNTLSLNWRAFPLCTRTGDNYYCQFLQSLTIESTDRSRWLLAVDSLSLRSEWSGFVFRHLRLNLCNNSRIIIRNWSYLFTEITRPTEAEEEDGRRVMGYTIQRIEVFHGVLPISDQFDNELITILGGGQIGYHSAIVNYP